MPITFDELHAEKNDIVKSLFIETADDNYITARWCFHQHLNVDFFWLAVHCLEKYFKAALLLNGKSAKGYSHDIEKLFNSVKSLAPELIPTSLEKPEDMPDCFWHPENTEQYFSRLNREGSADNRYQLYGYIRQPEDLFKLDQAVFFVRRLCQPLEVHFLGEETEGIPSQSRRDRMDKDFDVSWKLQSKLEETASGKRGKDLLHTLMNCNFPFAGDKYRHAETTFTSASQNPVLVRRIYEPLEYEARDIKSADKLWGWLNANIQIPKGFLGDMEQERAAIKARSLGCSP